MHVNQTLDIKNDSDLRADMAEAMHRNNYTQLQGAIGEMQPSNHLETE